MAQGIWKWLKHRLKNGVRICVQTLFRKKCAQILWLDWFVFVEASICRKHSKYHMKMVLCNVQSRQTKIQSEAVSHHKQLIRPTFGIQKKGSNKMSKKTLTLFVLILKNHFWCFGLVVLSGRGTLFWGLSFLIHYSRVVIFVTLTWIRHPFVEILSTLCFSMTNPFDLA